MQDSDRNMNLEDIEEILKTVADSLLKREFIQVMDKKSHKVEPPWFDKRIEENIQKKAPSRYKKEFNRLKRNAIDEDDRQYWWAMYMSQKNASRGSLLVPFGSESSLPVSFDIESLPVFLLFKMSLPVPFCIKMEPFGFKRSLSVFAVSKYEQAFRFNYRNQK